ncbi:hypothetical protein AVEN_182598-1 [Araneus ventricosus]|uniref:Uncharacterized protein n=1 Tax=Araneus ventricosus TaxID=182803 RepID=A0A4Y2LT35_ARAVE|nr:hypothetical protein AVEN_182598-1 [Araneus ventricosus]
MRVTRQRISSQRKLPWKGSQHNIQHPGASSERNLMQFPPNSGRMNGKTVTVEACSTSSFQRSILPQLGGKDQKSCFATAHGPLPTYFKRFGLRTTDCCCCGELGRPLHFATSYRLTGSYHFTKPQTTLIISGGKESSTNHCQEFK